MASRVSEVLYKLRDFFTQPARKIESGYADLRRASQQSADRIERDGRRMGAAFGRVADKLRGLVGLFAGGLAVRGAASGITGLADELDRLGKAAARLDIDPGTLAALEFAADRSGVAVTKMTGALDSLQKRIGEAQQGIGSAKIAFDALGISAGEFADLNVDAQLVILADALQGIASEEERAALASQLFSEANIDLLNVLNQGGDALAEYIKQGRAFNQVTTAATEAAAAYNDAMTNLGAAVEGLKVRAFTPVIRELNQWIGVAGQAGSETDNLKAKLEDARRELDYWQRNAALNPEALARSSAEVKRLSEALDEINAAQRRSKQANEQAAAARAAEAAALAAYKVQVAGLTDVYEDQAKARKAALDRETRELAAARREQSKIEDEFRGLVEDITQPDEAEVGLADVFGKINQAAAAASRGQNEAAVRLARQGGAQLRQLKDQGTEIDGVLKYLAERLQAVASQAAQQDTKLELIDEAQARESFDLISQRLGQLKSEAAIEGQAIGRALVAGIQAEVRAADIGLPAVVQAGIASYTSELDKRGAK